jgi:pilus assembly protein CpaB
MKPKTMILMIVAVTCGLGASYMTSRLLAERGTDEEKVTILVARKNLNMGDVIKTPDDMFVEKQVSKGDEPRLAIVEVEKLKGRQLKRSLRPGDFITPEDLIDDKNSAGISFILPQGHQAVGIRVNSETIAGGFASLPHSRVNIISTRRGSDDKSTKATLLLENVLVLAADTQTQRDETGRAMPANVVTVALKPEDVLKLELAKTLGTISLVLRKFNDQSLSSTSSYTAENLKTGTINKEGGQDDLEGPPPAVSVLPALPKVEEKKDLKKDDKGKFQMVIIEGDTQRKVGFDVDPNSKVPGLEVQRSEVNAPPPSISPPPAKKE